MELSLKLHNKIAKVERTNKEVEAAIFGGARLPNGRIGAAKSLVILSSYFMLVGH
jgi:hypothetical protein